MGNNSTTNINTNRPLKVVLFVSRNKDNKELKNFKERREVFLSTKTIDELRPYFHRFVKQGQHGEVCRMYQSVNARDNEKVKKEFSKWLFDQMLNQSDLHSAIIPSKLAAIAARKECALEHKWLLDYDEGDDRLPEFLDDVRSSLTRNNNSDNTITIHNTPNGSAVITEHGFDSRELVAKWGNVIKKDDMLCVMWITNNDNKK